MNNKSFFILGMFLVAPQGVFAPLPEGFSVDWLRPLSLDSAIVPFIDQEGNVLSYNPKTGEIKAAVINERELYEKRLDLQLRRDMKLTREEAIWIATSEAYWMLFCKGGGRLLKKYAGVSRFLKGWTRERYLEQWYEENENSETK